MYIDENGLAEFTTKMKTYIDNKFAPQPQEEYFLTFSGPNSFTLSVVNNQKYWDGTLETSTDKTNWTTWSGTSAVSSASDGTKHNIFVRGIGNTYITGSGASLTTARWVLTGTDIVCSGNIENLLDYATVQNGNHPPMATRCYRYLFSGSIISAPELPATTLTERCYESMFNSSGLKFAPKLPATILADYCYQSMFDGCVNLETIPSLSAVVLSTRCYYQMFSNCSNIKLSTTQTGEYVNEYRIPMAGTGTIGDRSVNNMFANTGGTFTGTPEINTTYYTSNEVV